MLRVKLKSLAAESRIIRQEESRGGAQVWELAQHRRTIVREASRHTLLAYSFIRGRAYHQIEKKCGTPPDWKEVEKMVVKYGMIFHSGYGWNYKAYEIAKADELNRFRIWQTIKRE